MAASPSGGGGPTGGKRRLPVLQPSSEPEPEGEPRPPWHWIVIGAVGILIAALALSLLSGLVTGSVLRGTIGEATDPEAVSRFAALSPTQQWALQALVLGAPALAIALAGVLGGMLVGRFGGQAGKREATWAGAGGAAMMSALLAAGPVPSAGIQAWLTATVIIVPLSALCARLGGAIGLRWRRRGAPRRD